VVTVVEAAGLYAFHAGPPLQIDVPKFRVLGWPRLGPPFVRIDPDLLADVREIARTAPPGATLGAVDYELALSMTTAQFQHYGLWPIDIITLYGERFGVSEEGQMRYGAARFLIGQKEFRADFERLLETPVRNVILSNRLGNDLSEMKAFSERRGFTLVKETTRYVLYTR